MQVNQVELDAFFIANKSGGLSFPLVNHAEVRAIFIQCFSASRLT